jgi:hypothetical protein
MKRRKNGGRKENGILYERGHWNRLIGAQLRGARASLPDPFARA